VCRKKSLGATALNYHPYTQQEGNMSDTSISTLKQTSFSSVSFNKPASLQEQGAELDGAITRSTFNHGTQLAFSAPFLSQGRLYLQGKA